MAPRRLCYRPGQSRSYLDVDFVQTPVTVAKEVTPSLPVLIQGGMGAGVSGWQLARAVSRTGQLGVVSGVALDSLLARRLQRGDPGGHLRRALAHFPVPEIAERVLRRYFVDGGLPAGRPFRLVPVLGLRPHPAGTQLAVVGNFAEVFLAKEGHDGLVGVNYLEKTQLATPAAVFGAMLAEVDYVLVGAGIPVEISGLLDGLAAGRPVELGVTVEGALPGERSTIALDPAAVLGRPAAPLRRPRFLAVVSSAVLAEYLMREPDRRPDGFVLEGPVAGGHSAPPRGRLHLDDNGEPVYGPRDKIDSDRVAALGLPFWLAGGAASPEAIRAALAIGATGVQVGSLFALCRESALDAQFKRQLMERALAGTLRVRNDPSASPTGFPFKVAELPGTLAVPSVYEARERLCDIGYLRQVYRTANGRIGYRCSAEPVHLFVRKGGDPAETVRRACLCNGLVAALGLGQQRANGYQEPAIVTLGQDLGFLSHVLPEGADDYTARQAVDYLLADIYGRIEREPAGECATRVTCGSEEDEDRPMNVFARPVAFVTGGSRGIGAATALALAAAGYDVAIGYRNKAARAEEVAAAIRQRGAAALPLGADITKPGELADLFAAIREWRGRLDVLVLNASGGLEADLVAADPQYPTRINRDAPLALVEGALPLLTTGGVVVFVTSHWAHRYGQVQQLPAYVPVAASKYAGEQALRARQAALAERGIRLLVVTGDLIEGTITPRLLERTARGYAEQRRSQVGRLPTADDMGRAIAAAVMDATATSGHTVVVGGALESLSGPA